MTAAPRLSGIVTVATHTWRPEWVGLSDAQILGRLGRPDEVSTNENILCVNGLTALVQAVNWSGIEDQNVNMGNPFSPLFLAPLYGAVGTGSTAVTSADTQLTAEVPTTGRSIVSAGGSTGASAANNPSVAWLFLIPVPSSTIVIAEAGLFLQATSTINTGKLLDHALISPTVTQTTAQLVTLSVTITMGN